MIDEYVPLVTSLWRSHDGTLVHHLVVLPGLEESLEARLARLLHQNQESASGLHALNLCLARFNLESDLTSETSTSTAGFGKTGTSP